MGYQPLEDYGIVGDLQTAALVGMNGSVDFLCPAFRFSDGLWSPAGR
jgi:hypothetical protein